MGRLEAAAQERAQPGDRGEAREQRGGGACAAAGDAGGTAEGVDERRAGDPNRDAGVACGDGDPVGLDERLVEDELGADGSEALSEAPARFVGRR